MTSESHIASIDYRATIVVRSFICECDVALEQYRRLQFVKAGIVFHVHNYYRTPEGRKAIQTRQDKSRFEKTCSLQYVANVYGLLGKILTVGDGDGSIPIDSVDN